MRGNKVFQMLVKVSFICGPWMSILCFLTDLNIEGG